MKKWRFLPLSPEGAVVNKPKTEGTAIKESAGNSISLRAPVVSVQIPLPVLEALGRAQGDLLVLFVDTGREVLQAMMEQDRIALCGPRGKRLPGRAAAHAGSAPSEVTLGGQRIAMH